MPATVLSTLHVFPHLILITMLQGSIIRTPPITDMRSSVQANPSLTAAVATKATASHSVGRVGGSIWIRNE